MKEKRVTKKAILASLLSVVVCSSMLIGTSYAWFTDTATSSGNVIKSGKLDIELSYLDGTTTKSEQSGGTVAPDPDDENADWKDASKEAIFDYDLWEPGYCAVKHIKIANVGNLALKYQFNIIPSGTLDVNENGNTLADAIDVYYFDPAKQISARDDAALANPTMKATLTEALAGLGDTGSGVLYPEGTEGKKSSDTITLVLKMREDAGNEYQDMDLGASFAVQVIATQYTYEADSFDDQYDANADTTPDIVMVTTPEGFAGALGNAVDGDTITIDAQGNDVGSLYNTTVASEVTIQNATFGGGNAVDGKTYDLYKTTFDKKVTFENCTFDADRNINLCKFNGGVEFDNCTFTGDNWAIYNNSTKGDVVIKNSKLNSAFMTINFQGGSGANNVLIDNCDISAWTSFGAKDCGKLTIRNSRFTKANGASAIRVYQNALIENCTFSDDFVYYWNEVEHGGIDACANNITIEIKNCTGIEGKLTVDNSLATQLNTVKFVVDGVETVPDHVHM